MNPVTDHLNSDTVGEIREFYDSTSWQYDIFWDSETMHYGHGRVFEFHEKRLENSNEYYATRLGPSRDDLILDAGCGKGGLAIHLANEYGCEVIGLDASPYQIQRARDNAERNGVEDLVTFVVGSYTGCPFSGDIFDGYVAIETICHAPDKNTVISEMARVLKENGSFVIGDGFRALEDITGYEKILWETMLDGWAVENLAYRSEFADALKREGFEFVFSNNKAEIWSSSLRQFLLGMIGVPVLFIGYITRMIDFWSLKQGITSVCQFYAFTFDMAVHGDFSGTYSPG